MKPGLLFRPVLQRRKLLHGLLVKANSARDLRSWLVAAAFYEAYLAEPEGERQAAIWVQLGHARKEAGDTKGAVVAYERAIWLAPGVADTHLHLGHLYKRLGALDAAIVALTEAVRHDPEIGDAREELQKLTQGRGTRTGPRPSEKQPPVQVASPPPLTPDEITFQPAPRAAYAGLSRRFGAS